MIYLPEDIEDTSGDTKTPINTENIPLTKNEIDILYVLAVDKAHKEPLSINNLPVALLRSSIVMTYNEMFNALRNLEAKGLITCEGSKYILEEKGYELVKDDIAKPIDQLNNLSTDEQKVVLVLGSMGGGMVDLLTILDHLRPFYPNLVDSNSDKLTESFYNSILSILENTLTSLLSKDIIEQSKTSEPVEFCLSYKGMEMFSNFVP